MADPLGGITGDIAKIITLWKNRPPWYKPADFPKIPTTGALGAISKFAAPVAAIYGIAKGGEAIYKYATRDFQKYADSDGRMGHTEWDKAGRPNSPYAKGGELEGVSKKVFSDIAGMTPQERNAYVLAQIAAKPQPGTDKTGQFAYSKSESGYIIPYFYDSKGIAQPDYDRKYEDRSYLEPTAEESPEAKAYRAASTQEILTRTAQMGQTQLKAPYGTSPFDNPVTEEVEGQFNPYTGEWEAPTGWISPAQKWEEEQVNKRQQDLIAWYREQANVEAEQRKQQQLSMLRANPASWLEYASLAGQTPVVQEWMRPLMPQQYQGTQVGQAIPGYSQSGAGMNLPELTTPSAQYMSRITPTARQQYYGYEKARTGANPEDVQWRLWSQAPPSGSYGGLQRTRY